VPLAFRAWRRAYGLLLVGQLGACGGRTSLTDWSFEEATGGLTSVGGVGGSPIVPGAGGAAGGGTGGIGVGGGVGGGLVCPGGVCEPWPVCDAGQWLVTYGPNPSDAVCEPCPPGTFSTTLSAPACDPWTECTWEQKETEAPSATQDRTCGGVYPVRQFGTPANEMASDVAVDAAGFVYVSGNTYGSLAANNAGEADAYVRKYSPAGSEEWTVQLGVSYYDDAFRLAFGPGGDLHVMIQRITPNVATTAFATLDAFGSVLEFHEQAGVGQDFVVDREGNDVFCALVSTESYFDIELRKVQVDGVPIWTAAVSTPGSELPGAVAMVGDDVILAGSTTGSLYRTIQGSEEAFVARFSSEGELVWGLQFGGVGWMNSAAVEVDQAGDLYVVGLSMAAYGLDTDGWVAKVSADGELLWLQTYNGRYSPNDSFIDAAIDSQNRLTVVGKSNGVFGESNHGLEDGFVARILAEGELGAVRQFGTPADEWIGGLAVAPDDALFVAGSTAEALGNGESSGFIDAFVLRIDGDL